jgi:ppGpp synthetase/RelA/SpoT-type nucleotidyltranferase
MTDEPGDIEVFDFGPHAASALERYKAVRPDYTLLAKVAKRLLSEMLMASGIRVHSIESRAKSLESFYRKAEKPTEGDSSQPKYRDPVREITDLAAVRVITFLLRTVEQVCALIEQEFIIRKRTDKSAELLDGGKLGYQSIHFLVEMHPNRTRLPKYKRHAGLVFEIQVRTLLQHAWAEMEHNIQYKSAAVIPAGIRKKFISLAGLLEIADREFQSLQDEDEKLTQQARASVQSGELRTVEITPDALKVYLDLKLGPDFRITQWSYDFIARILRILGFERLSQVDECIMSYNDGKISRLIWGSRKGQLSRFEDALLASMGEFFIDRHPWSGDAEWVNRLKQRLDKLAKGGVKIGSYVPGRKREKK